MEFLENFVFVEQQWTEQINWIDLNRRKMKPLAPKGTEWNQMKYKKLNGTREFELICMPCATLKFRQTKTMHWTKQDLNYPWTWTQMRSGICVQVSCFFATNASILKKKFDTKNFICGREYYNFVVVITVFSIYEAPDNVMSSGALNWSKINDALL